MTQEWIGSLYHGWSGDSVEICRGTSYQAVYDYTVTMAEMTFMHLQEPESGAPAVWQERWRVDPVGVFE